MKPITYKFNSNANNEMKTHCHMKSLASGRIFKQTKNRNSEEPYCSRKDHER